MGDRKSVRVSGVGERVTCFVTIGNAKPHSYAAGHGTRNTQYVTRFNSLLEESLDDIRDALDLAVGQLRINREAEAFAGGFFGDGKIASFIAK